MLPVEKDVFVVHSKSDEREAALVEALVPRLQEAGIEVWLYDDWSFEHRARRPGRGAPRSSGRLEELDLARYQAGDPMPFRAPVDEVDDATLAEMIHSSRVVVLCEPGPEGPSAGVANERRTLAGLAKGPILLHLLWPGSRGSFFERLGPTAQLRLSEDTASSAAVDEVFAGVATAWLVCNLQWKFGRHGGHRLLVRAVEREPSLRDLVERSPRHQEPAEEEAAAPSSVPSAITALFARLRPHEAAAFEEWWTKEAAAMRSQAAALRDGDAAGALRALIAEVDCSWRDAFGPTGRE